MCHLILSTDTSEKHKWVVGSKAASDSTVSSPALRKPKKQMLAAAQIRTISGSERRGSKYLWILCIIAVVMGSRLAVLSLILCCDLVPLTTPSNFGMLAMHGSGKPLATCRWRIGDRYDFIDEWEMLLLAKSVANRQRTIFSDW